jgi:hypothetical protein
VYFLALIFISANAPLHLLVRLGYSQSVRSSLIAIMFILS